MAGDSSVTRRSFVKSAAAAGAAAMMTAKAQRAIAGANDRIRIGVIGTGHIASAGHRASLRKIKDQENFEFAALCDVWKKRMDDYAAAVKKDFDQSPKLFDDYHNVLAEKNIDTVLIATPEHWHGRQIVEAVHAGKHVYVEKPMTHSIEESVEVLEAVKKTGKIVQVGVQGMSDDSYEAAREYIKTGKLGQIVHAQTDYVRWYGKTGPWRTGHTSDESKPADLDWGAWLGPAKKRPWDGRRYFDWRCYWDYSGGICTDLFVHRITRLMKALELGPPSRACGFGGTFTWPDGRETPDSFEMCLEYPRDRGMTVHVLGTMANNRGIKHMIRGRQASLIFTGGGFEVYPEDSKLGPKNKPIHTHKKTGGEDQALHNQNFFAAVRANKPEMIKCPPELGHAAVTAVCMANESYRRKAYMQWDDRKQNMKIASAV